MDDLDLGATIKGLSPGLKVFNRYTLVRMVGRGGMGVVWLARDGELGRDTALKFLPELIATDRASIEDLKHEVRRAMDLSHPNIVKIHDFVTDGRIAAVSMEFIAGDTLSSLRIDEPGQVFSPEKLAPWVAQLCSALAYAHHDAQVVHRDLKPANLMIDARGRLKVLDFGLAASLAESVSRVSRQSTGSGTPAYMSPQQLRGMEATVSDDLYSLGATLYELLTGQPPFKSTQSAVLMHLVMHELPLPINERRTKAGQPPVPDVWEETVQTLLAKEPKDRPQSAGEAARRLSSYSNTFGVMKSEDVSASEGAVEIPPFLGAIRSNSKGSLRKTLAVAFIGLALIGCYLDFAGSDHRPQGDAFMASFEQNKQEADAAAQQRTSPVISGPLGRLGKLLEPVTDEREREAIASAYFKGVLETPLPSLRQQMDNISDEREREIVEDVVGEKASAKFAELLQAEGYENSVRWLAEQKRLGEIDDDFIDVAFEVVKEKARQPIPGVSLQDAWEAVKLTPVIVYGLVKGGAKYVPLAIYENWVNIIKAREHRKYLGADVIGSSLLYGAYKIVRLTQRSWRALISDIYDYTDEKLRERMVKDIKFYEFMNAIEERAGFRAAVPLGAKIVHDSVERDPEITKPQIGQPWENTLGMKFVPVPGTDVLFSVWETREQDYAAFVRATGRPWDNANAGPTHPAVKVSWEDAQAFCSWLTQEDRRAGRLGPDQSYRLPTDAEWSIAVGLPNEPGSTPFDKDMKIKNHYPWGTQWPPPRGAGNYAQSLNVDTFERTAPVGSFSANTHGLYDLGGNVWEWVQDEWYPGSGRSVMRGASFGFDTPTALLSSNRLRDTPDFSAAELGFRVVVAVGLAEGPIVRKSVASDSADLPQAGKAYMIAELNLELMPIAAGSFVMGSPVSEFGRHNDEGPQTHVTLTKPFWLGKTEVTQAQWAAIMGNNPSNFKGDNLPVEQVSWNDAMEYCRNLTERERLAGRLPVGYAYTLPTEAQWEYACRAGTTGEYAGTGILDEMGWYGKNSENTTHPVGQKNANAWGLHDMHGNVWEWCLDWRGAYPGGKVSDPSGALTGKDRVNRGGGWENYSDNCRSADRMALSSGYTYSDLGFRVALAPIPRREGL